MYNPIKSVNGVKVKSPSSYKWKEEDLSNKSAGRTEDTLMSKNRIGQIVGLDLAWNNLTLEDAATILQLFDPQYITVEYLDAKKGGYKKSEFYVGNRSAPLYNGELGVWSNISFSLIERSGK